MSDLGKSKEQLLAELTELRSLAQRHRAYFDEAPQAIYVVNAEGGCIDANPAACRQSGYSRDELLELAISDLTTSAAPRGLLARLERDGPLVVETQVRRKDGTKFEAAVEAVRVSPDRYMASVTDITRFKQHEAALRRERDRAQTR